MKPKQLFSRWMASVDLILLAKVGLDSRDLADIAYHDLWAAGLSPHVAAFKAIKANA